MRSAWTIALALTAVAVTSPAAAKTATGSYTSLTVFGDSLVDAGNFLRGTIDEPSRFPGGPRPNPALGYFNGRWTNGYDYTDYLSLGIVGTPTVASRLGGSNYAYGGARVLNTSASPPHLPEQYNSYLSRIAGGTAAVDANGLYVLNFGANDLFNIGTVAGTDPAAQRAVIAQAAASYADYVGRLDALGVRNILVTSFPLATDLSTYGTQQFYAALDGLSLNADTTLFRFNYVEAFGRIQQDPTSFGIAPFTQSGACITSPAAVRSGCVGYFSFDGTHPVAAVQRALFDDMNRQFALVSNVPEPATWGLMILGFAAVGGAMRSRRTGVRFRTA